MPAPRRLLLVLLLALLAAGAAGSAGGPASTAGHPRERRFDAARIREFRAQPEFDYRAERPASLSFLDRLLAWLGEKIFGRLVRGTTLAMFQAIVYLLAAGSLLFVGYLVFQRFRKGGPGGLLYAEKTLAAAGRAATGEEPDPEERERRISACVREGRFADAIRLMYTAVLLHLAEHRRIAWRDGKTNGEYCREAPAPLRSPLLELTSICELLSYGDGDADAALYERFRLQAAGLRRLAEPAP